MRRKRFSLLPSRLWGNSSVFLFGRFLCSVINESLVAAVAAAVLPPSPSTLAPEPPLTAPPPFSASPSGFRSESHVVVRFYYFPLSLVCECVLSRQASAAGESREQFIVCESASAVDLILLTSCLPFASVRVSHGQDVSFIASPTNESFAGIRSQLQVCVMSKCDQASLHIFGPANRTRGSSCTAAR